MLPASSRALHLHSRNAVRREEKVNLNKSATHVLPLESAPFGLRKCSCARATSSPRAASSRVCSSGTASLTCLGEYLHEPKTLIDGWDG
eukprot:scaffold576_cov260-Pinguiococcus_pyrenoidosus.AAC.92